MTTSVNLIPIARRPFEASTSLLITDWASVISAKETSTEKPSAKVMRRSLPADFATPTPPFISVILVDPFKVHKEGVVLLLTLVSVPMALKSTPIVKLPFSLATACNTAPLIPFKLDPFMMPSPSASSAIKPSPTKDSAVCTLLRAVVLKTLVPLVKSVKTNLSAVLDN